MTPAGGARHAPRIIFDGPLTAEEAEPVVSAVRRGDVVAVPTDTVWGLSADPFSRTAVDRVARLKGRGPAKAFLVLISEPEQLTTLGVVLDERLRGALLRMWPAPVTVILPIVRPIPASAGGETLGVRMPADERLRRLVRFTGPVISTSANREGSEPAGSADEVDRLFGTSVAWVLDGAVSSQRPSTVVDTCRPGPLIQRTGAGDEAATRFLREISGNPKSL